MTVNSGPARRSLRRGEPTFTGARREIVRAYLGPAGIAIRPPEASGRRRPAITGERSETREIGPRCGVRSAYGAFQVAFPPSDSQSVPTIPNDRCMVDTIL